MSLARLWRDQGKVQQARELLGSGLRVVHGGVRHARSEGGEGVAGGVGDVSLFTGVRTVRSNDVERPLHRALR